jgi:hypothetical protein
MEPDTTTRARIAALSKELEAIYVADTVYWRQDDHTRDDRAQYHRRQERLEEIRNELAELTR